jgi:hypothetical protein
MIKQRQYRGGYQVAGLVELARELRRNKHRRRRSFGSFFEIVDCWVSSSDDNIRSVIT